MAEGQGGKKTKKRQAKPRVQVAQLEKKGQTAQVKKEMAMQREVVQFFTEITNGLRDAKLKAKAAVIAKDGPQTVEALSQAQMPLGGPLDDLVADLDIRIADDYTLVDPYGEVVRKPMLIQRLRSGRAIFDDFAYKDVNVRIYRSKAVMTNFITLKATFGGRPFVGTYAETHTLQKLGTVWQVVATHMGLVQEKGGPLVFAP
jgi:hypothetical protein